MNFKQRAANGAHSPTEDYGTLEHQAEQAARMAGKSVEAWLQDVISEQTSALQATAHHGDAAQRETDYVAKSAVLNELVERVRYLEDSFDAQHQHQHQQQQFAETDTSSLSSALDNAARNLNQNYDEDARVLIEGIRARAQNQSQLPPNPPQQPQAPQPQPQTAPAQSAPLHSAQPSMSYAPNPTATPQDANADRMMEMLGTLGYLEQQLKSNLQQANAQPVAMMQAMPHQQVYAQPNVASLGMPAPAPQVAPVPSVMPVNNEDTMRFTRLEEQLSRMEKHLTAPQQAEVSHEPELEDDQVYRPKRSRRTKRNVKSGSAGQMPILSKSSNKMGKRQGNQALREAMGAIVEQHTVDTTKMNEASANEQAQTAQLNTDRRELDQHFQTLMAKIGTLNSDSLDPAMIENLKDELSDLKGEVTAANAQTSFAGQHIQEEVKRLRTIIASMQSSDVDSMLGSRLEVLETDVNRIAEFLLKSPDLSNVPEDTTKLQSELNRLSDGLLAVIDRTERATSDNSNLVVSQLQQNLAGLRDDIVSHMRQHDNSSNVASAVSSSFEDRFSNLKSDFDTSLSALNVEVKGLGAGLKDQVSIISAQVHSATERLEVLGNARNGDANALEQFSQMEGRLVKAAERLEAASMDAASTQGGASASLLQLPVDLVTEQSLRSELGDFANALGSTLESGQSSMVQRIDEALAKLDIFSEKQEKLIENIAHRSAEKTAQKIGSMSISENSEPIDTSGMQYDLGEIRQMATSLLTSSNNSFVSVHGLLDGVAGRLEKLEQQGGIAPNGDDASTAALATELQGLRDYMSSMKTSTDDLSTETRTSFHSVQDMLSRVSDRLEVLETAGAQAAPLMVSNATSPAVAVDDYDQTDGNLNSAQEHDTQEEPAFRTSSAPTEEEVMQRMREHVKAREPDAPILVPEDDDMPIEPGSGRPVLKDDTELSSIDKPAFENKHVPIVADETFAQFEEELEDDEFDMDVEDQTADSNAGSKEDFIQAARRAAQAAAADQALQLDNEPESGKSPLAAIRERINMVARGGRKSVLEGNDEKEVEIDAPVLELDSAAAIKADLGDPNIDAKSEKLGGVDGDLVDQFVDEQPKSSPLRTALMASVCVAILSVTGYLLKDPINAMIGGSSTNTASQQTQPNTVKKAAEVKKAVQQSAVEPKVKATSNSADINDQSETSIDLNATSLPPSITEGVDDAQIVDPSTTQSIARQLDFNEASPQSAVIRDAMQLLPKDKVSDKLSDALLEGDPAALLELGRRYGDGEIFERDLKKSAFWYEQAAANGSAIAKFRLGTLYEDGIGVPKNPRKAKRWYIEAADSGNARAMHNLAVLHAEGSLGRSDFEEAFNWFDKGANHGIKDSQFNVGILYVRGLGVGASLVQAYKWFDIVAKTGDRDAAEKRDEIAKALTKTQLKEAKEQSATYKPIPIRVDANVISPSPKFWLSGSKLAVGSVPNGLPKQTAKKQGSQQVKEAQLLLNGLGFSTGAPDGFAGKRTRDAVKAFEYEIGMPQTGRVNKNLIELLKSQKI